LVEDVFTPPVPYNMLLNFGQSYCPMHSTFPPISPFSICSPPSYWILFLCYCLPVGSHFRPQIQSFSV